MRILHVEDSPLDAELTRAQLESELSGCEIVLASSKTEFIEQLGRGGFDLVLSDFGLGDFDGFEALSLAQQHAPGVPFVFLSGTIGDERAIAIMRAGAQDYVLKDRPWRLAAAINRAVAEAREKHQRQAAEQAHQRLVTMLENTPDLVAMAAPDERILYLNPAGRALLGIAPDLSLNGLQLAQIAPPPGLERLRGTIMPQLLADGTWTGELTLRGAGDRVIPVAGVLLAHRGSDGAVAYFSAMLRDQTTRQEAERRLREQAELLNRASESICVHDQEGRITFWNRGAERTLGWSASEALQRPWTEVLRLADERAVALVEAGLERHGEWHGELIVFDHDHQRRVLESGFTVIRDDRGQARARLIISTDITEKKQLEEKFLRAQRLESIGMLATGIAHDLNNVLAPVLLGVTMLRERGLEEDVVKVLGSLERSAERGAGLVRQILAFAHGIGGELQVFEIRHLLRDVAGVARETFPRNIRIEQEVARHLWPIRANPTHIHQVLLNLIVNARDAMPDGGLLRLSAENRILDTAAAAVIPGARPGTFLYVQVEDSGTGIPPDVIAHIWEPFFTTKEPGKGTGLGLSTVRGIVQSHGGFIVLETQPGRGTRFGIYLPAAEGATGPEEETAPASAAPRGNNELLLLVDDETQVRELVGSILTHHGYRVVIARDGIEAVALFAPRSQEIRLVITDLQMPNLDGAALAAVIRRLNPATKLIAASGMSEDAGGRAHPLATLADAFLPKPYKAETLLGAVHRLLQPAPDPAY